MHINMLIDFMLHIFLNISVMTCKRVMVVYVLMDEQQAIIALDLQDARYQ
jgi:hypothetical protein